MCTFVLVKQVNSAPAASNKEEAACLSVVAYRRRMVKVAVALGVAVELLPPSTVT
jgi:hypothetical protein